MSNRVKNEWVHIRNESSKGYRVEGHFAEEVNELHHLQVRRDVK
jgi:hypothetical protein